MTKGRREPYVSRYQTGNAENSRGRWGVRPQASRHDRAGCTIVLDGYPCRRDRFTNCHGRASHCAPECVASANHPIGRLLIPADPAGEEPRHRGGTFPRDFDSYPLARTVVGRVASSARRCALCFSRCAAFAGFPAETPGRFSSSLPPLFASGSCAAILIPAWRPRPTMHLR